MYVCAPLNSRNRRADPGLDGLPTCPNGDKVAGGRPEHGPTARRGGGLEDDSVVRLAFAWVFDKARPGKELVSHQDGKKSGPELHSATSEG